jgi:hypothetical protein
MAQDDRKLLEGIAHDMTGVAFCDLVALTDAELVEILVGGYVYDKAAIRN